MSSKWPNLHELFYCYLFKKPPILTLKQCYHWFEVHSDTKLRQCGLFTFRGNVLTEELVWHTSHEMQVHVNILLAA